MLTIGVTGGIGSGKTTVTDLFQQLHNTPVIDADIEAHEVAKPNGIAYPALLELLGKDCFDSSGVMNRPVVRERIFNTPSLKKDIEHIIHPHVTKSIHRFIATQKLRKQIPYILVVIPLLIEKNWQSTFDRILVVDCLKETQIQRALSRDGSKRETIERIVAQQVSRKERLSQADDTINTELSIEQVNARINELHDFYLSQHSA